MGQGSERLHVQLVACVIAIEAACHEMAAAILLQQTAVAHGDLRSPGHSAVGEFNQAIALGIFKFFVLVAAHAIELQQPVAESWWSLQLAGAHLTSAGIPGNQRLGPGPPRRCANPEDRLQRSLPLGFLEGGGQTLLLRQDLGSQGHEVGDLDGPAGFGAGPLGRHEFQSAHAPLAGVAEPLHGIEALRRPALPGQPGVDQIVAEAIRQGIGEEPRQATKGAAWQFREAVDALFQRHHEGRQLDATGQERGLIFEGGDTGGIGESHSADACTPEFNGRNGHGWPQLQEVAGLVRRRRLARLRVACCCSSRARGEGWGSGSSCSSRSRRSS